MQGDLIVVFGGSGFVGKQVVRALAKAGKRVRVAMRRPHLGIDLKVLGEVGQIQLMQANVRYPASVDAALEGASGAVNLVGVLNESGAQNFNALHAEGARAIAEACAKHGVQRLVQISAIGAAPKGARYAKSKFAGEEAVRKAVPSATILRPSIVFGLDDGFFNRFANMAKFAPALPLIGGGKTKFQPVFVGDVAEAVVKALDSESARGQVYELGGPQTFTYKELMQFILREIDRPRALISIPFVFAHPLGMLLDWSLNNVPKIGPLLSEDQVTMLHKDNVVSPDAKAFADLGVTDLETIEAIAPSYLWRFRPYGQFQTKQNPA